LLADGQVGCDVPRSGHRAVSLTRPGPIQASLLGTTKLRLINLTGAVMIANKTRTQDNGY
jgi:hypothetical protein